MFVSKNRKARGCYKCDDTALIFRMEDIFKNHPEQFSISKLRAVLHVSEEKISRYYMQILRKYTKQNY